MFASRVCVVLVGVLVATAAAQTPGCEGTPNKHPVYEDEPTMVASVANGVRYVTGPADQLPRLPVIHVYGTPYEMGQAYGALMKEEISQMLPQAYDYMYSQIQPYLKSLPADLQKLIEKYGTELALNITLDATSEFIPDHYFQQVKGMANTTGIDQLDILRIGLLPELIKASCSMMGAWGPATASDTGLLQLRALDWTTDGPFQQFPLVINFHPTESPYDYTILTWSGLIGAITGVSSSGVAISEKVWLHYRGHDTIFGKPFHFVLEDILRSAMDNDQAMSQIATANRTCSIFVGVGDKHNNEFKIVEYSKETVNIFNDRNFPSYTDHDIFQSLLFVNKHTQPSADPCFNNLMHEQYGSVSALSTIQTCALQQTGDMHIAITDFQNELWYVSNAAPVTANGTVVKAYDRAFTRLNLTALWKHPNAAAPSTNTALFV